MILNLVVIVGYVVVGVVVDFVDVYFADQSDRQCS